MLKKIIRNLVFVPAIVKKEHGLINTVLKGCKIFCYEGLNGVSLRLRAFKSPKEDSTFERIFENFSEKGKLLETLKAHRKFSRDPRFFFDLESKISQ